MTNYACGGCGDYFNEKQGTATDNQGIEEFICGNCSEREEMKPKTGFISCAICGAKVQATLKTYGGLRRLVCSNNNCSESERKAFN